MACNANTVWFARSQRQLGYPEGYTLRAIFGTEDPSFINAIPRETFDAQVDAMKKKLRQPVSAMSNESEAAVRRAKREATTPTFGGVELPEASSYPRRAPPTHLTLHSGAAARDRETGNVCRVVARVFGSGAWHIWVPGNDELVERTADKLEAIEAPPNLPPLPARPMPRPAALRAKRPRAAAPRTAAMEDSDAEGEAAPQQVASRRPRRAAATEAARKLEEQAGQVVQEGAETPDVFPPPSPASDDAEAPAAPAPDVAAERVAPWLAHGQNVVAALTATALREPAGRSRAFEEAVDARVAFHGSGIFAELTGRAGASGPEARFVTETLAPDFQNLAVAEILGDAAPSASSPRDPSPDELAAMLQRFALHGGNVNALLAKAGVAPGQS
jgi:hypothetical protein